MIYAGAMFGCSTVAAQLLAARRVLVTRAKCRDALWLCLALASACTDPVFVPADAGEPPSDEAGTPGQAQPQERVDAGEPTTPPATCEQPSCGEDAATSTLGPGPLDGGGSEAGSELAPDAGLDPVRANWVGRYAARSALYTFDDPLKSTAKLLSIISIQPSESGGLTMGEEMCFYEGSWNFFYTGQLRYTFTGTRGAVPLKYDANKFESELLKLQIGYGPAPAECRPGGTLPAGMTRPWLTTSTCDCPRNDDPPTSLRDCRVIDQEEDKLPGATFGASIETQAITYHTTQEERVALHNGYRIKDRLYAELSFEETTRVLQCVIDGKVTAAAGCPGGAAKPCPSYHNTVEMTAIPPGLSCEQVILMERGLFPSPLPPYPESCPSEVAGTAATGR